MDPDVRRLLFELRQKVEENNRILRGLQMSSRLAAIASAIKWLIIIGATVGSYYYALPYINQIIATYESIQSGVQNVKKSEHLPNLPDIIKTIQKL